MKGRVTARSIDGGPKAVAGRLVEASRGGVDADEIDDQFAPVLVICARDGPTCQVMLSERHAAMLDFERSWWNNDEPRDQVIRARFQCSPDEYHAELTTVLDDPAAMDHDPLVVRRLTRLRLRARKLRHDGADLASSGGGEGHHA
jgi:hypothetical protein